MPEFLSPEFTQSIEPDDYISRVPANATIKGMFLSSVLDALAPDRDRVAEGNRRYVGFKDYPLSLQVRLIPQVAKVLFPDLKLREGIRRVGHRVYPALAASLLGKVLFAAVGKDPAALLHAGAKAYSMSASVGSAEILEIKDRMALISMRDIYNYIDCYQIGIFEGGFSILNLTPSFRLKLDSLSSGALEVRW